MTGGILDALGGLGVFLLGMVVMTGGLKSIAGNALRQALARFTKSPTSGAVTGAIATAIVQSSSATTVTAVGFVGAGLITFPQALGIIFGANIGTTITGWLVAILGFKLKIGSLALPFVLIGVLMHLFLPRRLSAFGLTLAGFGMIFVGIELIQTGLSGLEGVVTPDSFPGDTSGGRLLLVGIGIAVTLVTQSSSAGIAAALAAVHAGTISFEQAAVMVIGMNVGTTATAVMATVGGSTDVRRTGFAHVIFNLMTGVLAFLLVTPYTRVCSNMFPIGFRANPEIALVGFHTFFNTVGVILILPLTGAFARLMIWLVPRQPVKYTQRLDRSLYESPVVAMGAVTATLRELTEVVFTRLIELLETGPSDKIKVALKEANEALKKTRDFLPPIDTSADFESLYAQEIASLHLIDHLRRLIDRCQQSKRARRVNTDTELMPIGAVLLDSVKQALAETTDPEMDLQTPPGATAKSVWQKFDSDAEQYRQSFIANAADDKYDPRATIRKLDTLRWARRVSYHVWRIVHYQRGSDSLTATRPVETQPAESDDMPHQ